MSSMQLDLPNLVDELSVALAPIANGRNNTQRMDFTPTEDKHRGRSRRGPPFPTHFPPPDTPITCAATIPRFGTAPRIPIRRTPRTSDHEILFHLAKMYPRATLEDDRHYRLPHPTEFDPPLEPEEKYYAVLSGQAVGVFDDWDIVFEVAAMFPTGVYREYPTWNEALAAYAKAFESDTLTVSPFPGGFWDNPIPIITIEDDDVQEGTEDAPILVADDSDDDEVEPTLVGSGSDEGEGDESEGDESEGDDYDPVLVWDVDQGAWVECA